MANFFLDWLQGLGRRRPTLLGGAFARPVGIAPDFEEQLRGARLRGRAVTGLRAAEAGERRIAETPYHEFMPRGAARQAAEARGEVGTPAGAARIKRGVRKHKERMAALGGRTLLRGRGAGRIERFSITQKPQTEEATGRLAAYRKREKERKTRARAGKRSVLRGRGRYGTRR